MVPKILSLEERIAIAYLLDQLYFEAQSNPRLLAFLPLEAGLITSRFLPINTDKLVSSVLLLPRHLMGMDFNLSEIEQFINTIIVTLYPALTCHSLLDLFAHQFQHNNFFLRMPQFSKIEYNERMTFSDIKTLDIDDAKQVMSEMGRWLGEKRLSKGLMLSSLGFVMLTMLNVTISWSNPSNVVRVGDWLSLSSAVSLLINLSSEYYRVFTKNRRMVHEEKNYIDYLFTLIGRGLKVCGDKLSTVVKKEFHFPEIGTHWGLEVSISNTSVLNMMQFAFDRTGLSYVKKDDYFVFYYNPNTKLNEKKMALAFYQNLKFARERNQEILQINGDNKLLARLNDFLTDFFPVNEKFSLIDNSNDPLLSDVHFMLELENKIQLDSIEKKLAFYFQDCRISYIADMNRLDLFVRSSQEAMQFCNFVIQNRREKAVLEVLESRWKPRLESYTVKSMSLTQDNQILIITKLQLSKKSFASLLEQNKIELRPDSKGIIINSTDKDFLYRTANFLPDTANTMAYPSYSETASTSGWHVHQGIMDSYSNSAKKTSTQPTKIEIKYYMISQDGTRGREILDAELKNIYSTRLVGCYRYIFYPKEIKDELENNCSKEILAMLNEDILAVGPKQKGLVHIADNPPKIRNQQRNLVQLDFKLKDPKIEERIFLRRFSIFQMTDDLPQELSVLIPAAVGEHNKIKKTLKLL